MMSEIPSYHAIRPHPPGKVPCSQVMALDGQTDIVRPYSQIRTHHSEGCGVRT